MNSGLYIAKSKIAEAGKGVFTMSPIKKGDIVEICHVLIFKAIEEPSWLDPYSYIWDGDNFALALGYGSLYNHCYFANLEYSKNFKDGVIVFSATRNIQKGEELTIDYCEHYKGDPKEKELIEYFHVHKEVHNER